MLSAKPKNYVWPSLAPPAKPTIQVKLSLPSTSQQLQQLQQPPSIPYNRFKQLSENEDAPAPPKIKSKKDVFVASGSCASKKKKHKISIVLLSTGDGGVHLIMKTKSLSTLDCLI